MASVRGVFASKARKLLATVLIMLGVVTTVPMFAGLASAHHAYLDSSVACTGVVSWTAKSWSTGAQGTNPDIRVELKVDSGAFAEIGAGAFNSTNNYRFSSTFNWPTGATTIQIRTRVVGTWGNGNTAKDNETDTLSKPTNCANNPQVSKAVSCVTSSPGNGSGTIVLTLTNAATGPFAPSATFKVYNPDQTTTSTNYVVAVGGSQNVTFSGLNPDGAHSVKITLVGPGTDLTQNFTIDCDSPQPSVTNSVACVNGDGAVTITLSNTGGEPVTFAVTNPSTNVVENVVVAANSSTTRTFGGYADGQHTVVVKVGSTVYSQTFTIDCDQPNPATSAVASCDEASRDGKVIVTLANTGTEGVTFAVTNPFTNVVENVVVAANGSTTRTFAGFTDGVHTVAITADGKNLSVTFTITCDLAPDFSYTQSCVNGNGQVELTLANNGDDVNAVFVVDSITHTLTPGQTKVVTVGNLTDGLHTIAITLNDVDKSVTVSVDCDRPGEPAVEIAKTCVDEDGSVTVTLKNVGGELPLTFTVNGAQHVVNANSTKDVVVSGLLDGTRTITITQGNTDFSRQIEIDCDLAPTVDHTQQCVEGTNGRSDGEVAITLHNNGDDVSVTFSVDGTNVTVGPKASKVVTISELADGEHTIPLSVGDLNFDVTVTVDCDHPGEGAFDVVATCVDFDGTVVVHLTATGGELPVVFVLDGTTTSVDPNETVSVTFSGLADGPYSFTLSIGGKPQEPIEGTINCDPVFQVAAVCNTVDSEGDAQLYWYEITNTEETDVTVTWEGGSKLVPAGESATVSSATAPLVLSYDGVELMSTDAADVACLRDVEFTKELVGQPPTGETYTIRVSRLVGAVYAEELTFDLNAGVPVTISLPSTLDPEAIDYLVEEIDAGTASTSSISPDHLALSGNLGETISVVVTNGYASVSLDKQSLTPTVVAGGQLTYTLQATNTGGLTLDPVIISDRLPGQVELLSVSVADGAGLCALTEIARPQLVTCVMDDALPPGGLTKLITLTVQVDSSVSPGTTILNQAKVLGWFSEFGSEAVPGLIEMTCLPPVAGTVCDLSAKLGVPVTEVDQEAPTTTVSPTTTTVVRSLPRTGGSSPLPTMVLAFSLAGLGTVLLLARRRVAH